MQLLVNYLLTSHLSSRLDFSLVVLPTTIFSQFLRSYRDYEYHSLKKIKIKKKILIERPAIRINSMKKRDSASHSFPYICKKLVSKEKKSDVHE